LIHEVSLGGLALSAIGQVGHVRRLLADELNSQSAAELGIYTNTAREFPPNPINATALPLKNKDILQLARSLQ